MPSRRAERTAELIHAELARIFREEIKDPRVGSISITHVQVAGDRGVARVYYTPLGGRKPGKDVVRGIRSAGGFMRSRVAKALDLRHAPQLVFLLDEGIDEAVRMTALLGQMEAKHKPAAEEEGEE